MILVDKKYILLAEDDKFFAKVFSLKLEKSGHEVKVAQNGQELIKFAKERKPDLILLDLIMPVMDGFEALSELKKDPELKNIKVIVMSNLEQKEDITKTKDLGAAGYVSKVDTDSFASKVEGFLQ
jgi:CheY-like chemotaxis protein